MIIIGTLKKIDDFDKLWEDIKLEIKVENPTFFNKTTVYDAICNISGTSKTGKVKNTKPETDYQKYLASENEWLKNHNKTNHSPKAIARIKKVSPGENFEVLKENIKSVHSGAYGRLCWDKPAQTITTRFDTPIAGRFIHPEEHRTLTPREAARLQSFPDDFEFLGNRTSVCKQIGDAVPPKVSYFLSKLVDKMVFISR